MEVNSRGGLKIDSIGSAFIPTMRKGVTNYFHTIQQLHGEACVRVCGLDYIKIESGDEYKNETSVDMVCIFSTSFCITLIKIYLFSTIIK
jgi:hypothetical protein